MISHENLNTEKPQRYKLAINRSTERERKRKISKASRSNVTYHAEAFLDKFRHKRINLWARAAAKEHCQELVKFTIINYSSHGHTQNINLDVKIFHLHFSLYIAHTEPRK